MLVVFIDCITTTLLLDLLPIMGEHFYMIYVHILEVF